MKKIILFTLALTMVFLGMKQDLNGQTKVFDQTITWYHPPYQYGGYGFYWWHRTDGYSNINYGNMPSSNWVSPTDYYNGNFTMSVEVISQPTSEAFYLQFGIWGDKHKGSLHTETVASRKYISGGAGSSGTFGLGSPANWWNKQSGDRVDFTRANDFYRIGVVLWDGASTCIPMGHEWSAAGCPENAYKYFPMTVKISVYASGGSGPPPPPPPTVNPPSYSIDYWGVRTNKVISTEDQYSYQSNFSSVVDGNGQYLSLTPGTNVYFRKKSDHSKTQSLTVPYRPGAPSFGIDYVNERTSATVSDEYDYSSNSDMSSSSRGGGSHVSLSPGSNKYFRKRPTGSNFASNKQTLTVPGRPGAPSFGIDYVNERTSETVSSEYIYSANSDMSSSSSGDGSRVSLSPGSNKYFRKRSSGSNFASNKQTLTVPGRPAAPAFAIDYINERTSETVSSEYIYSANSDMSSSSSGDGSRVSLSPGSNKYFRKQSSGSNFASNKQTLTVPGRPAAPGFGIDFINEQTSENVSSEYIYSSNNDMSSSSSGDGSQVSLMPGFDLYFMKSATGSAFASGKQALAVPDRPADPSFKIDFSDENTVEEVGSEYIYSTNGNMTASLTGDGTRVMLTPGSDIYFMKTASVSAFASGKQALSVPGRPSAPSFEIDFMKEELSMAIGTGYLYAYQSDLSDATQGSGNTLQLTPGKDVYFQGLASLSAFASEIQILVSPDRPAAPVVGINYASESTDELVAADLQYSESSGFETAEQGSGSSVDLVPGTVLYFRQGATASSYVSEAYELLVPERPVVSSAESGSTTLYPFMAEFTFLQDVLSLDASGVSLMNAELKNMNMKSSGIGETVFEGEVFATANDVISISLPANVIQEGNFSSSAYTVSYTGQLPAVGIEGADISSFTVFPNPGKGVFHMKFENYSMHSSYKVECCSLSGSVVHTEEFYGTENVRMDLSDLSKGLYLLRLSENGQERGVVKLIIE